MERHFQLSTAGTTASETGFFNCGDYATLEEALKAADNPAEFVEWIFDSVTFAPTGAIVARRDASSNGLWVFKPEFEMLRLHLVTRVPGVLWDRGEHNCKRDVIALRTKIEAEYPQIDWQAVYKAAAGFTIEAPCHVCGEKATHIIVRYYLHGDVDRAYFECDAHAEATRQKNAELLADEDDGAEEGEEYDDAEWGEPTPDQVLPLESDHLATWAKFLYQRWLG